MGSVSLTTLATVLDSGEPHAAYQVSHSAQTRNTSCGTECIVTEWAMTGLSARHVAKGVSFDVVIATHTMSCDVHVHVLRQELREELKTFMNHCDKVVLSHFTTIQ